VISVFLEHDSELVRISYDTSFVNGLLAKCSDFFLSSVLPELLTRRLYSRVSENTQSPVDDGTVVE
jgi:hypothetical protein